MSKSLGNGIDPLDVIEKYGTDALRFMLASSNTPGTDMRFKWDRVESARNFANKIWNASRFIQMNLEVSENKLPDLNKLTTADKWILSRYNKVVKEVTENIEKFETAIAAHKLYEFVWDDFCDWYIELTKPVLYDQESPNRENTQYILVYVLSNTLKLLHPFMPFITEAIWRSLPHNGDSIMISQWPQFRKKLEFTQEENNMQAIMETIKGIRNIRAEMNVPPSKKAKAYIVTSKAGNFKEGSVYFEKLAGISEVAIKNSKKGIPENAVSVITADAETYLPLEDLVDREKELSRLSKEKEKLQSEIERVNKMLSNQGFVSKAPKEKIEEEKAKRATYEEMLEKVLERIKIFEA
jgi:valyl-tRNA synthetase